MSTVLIILLLIVLVLAAGALVIQSRRSPSATGLDESVVRQLLTDALAQASQASKLGGTGTSSDIRSIAPDNSTGQLGGAAQSAGGPASSSSSPGLRATAVVGPETSGRSSGGRGLDLDNPGPAPARSDKTARDAGTDKTGLGAGTDKTGLGNAGVDRVGVERAGLVSEGVDKAGLSAAEQASLAHLRLEASQAAAEIRSAASDAAKELRERSRTDADRLRNEARADADATIAAARSEAAELRTGIQAERARLSREAADALANDRQELVQAQERLRTVRAQLAEDQAAFLDDRNRLRSEHEELGRSRSVLDGREEALRAQAVQLADRSIELDDMAGRIDSELLAQRAELSRISGLTEQAARTELLAGQEEAVRRDAAFMIRRVEAEAEAEAKTRARAIVSEAVQRVASDQTAQSVVSVVHLPADEVKGRIIGREGRNIRAFETITGVNIIIDDTPEAVLLSCFDPVRREVGRITLQMLIDDGRIHPHRIEEAYERAGDEVDALCRRAAEDALLEVGITDLHPELVSLIGRLKYRTSYGQNVLGHLIETSHIARIMASEMGMDPKIVARGAFLHDIGKALTHEAQGSHAIVGAELARRYGESEEVAHCIEAHHDEVLPSTVEAVLTQAADSCSGGRPGARRESLESYVQRLEKIEAIASSKKGVEKVFAMQAGRELRVMVKPDVVDDLEAHLLAREVAKQIEEELTYPGQVRVTVIRESRATEIAR